MSLTTELAFYGLYSFSFPDSGTLQGHLCRFLCYIEDHQIYQKINRLTSFLQAKNLGERNLMSRATHLNGHNGVLDGVSKA